MKKKQLLETKIEDILKKKKLQITKSLNQMYLNFEDLNY